MACSNIRYGPGVASEVGKDFVNLKSKKVMVTTDTKVYDILIFLTVIQNTYRNYNHFFSWEIIFMYKSTKLFVKS